MGKWEEDLLRADVGAALQGSGRIVMRPYGEVMMARFSGLLLRVS